MPGHRLQPDQQPGPLDEDGHHLYSPRTSSIASGRSTTTRWRLKTPWSRTCLWPAGQIKKVPPQARGRTPRPPDTGLFTRRVDLIFWH